MTSTTDKRTTELLASPSLSTETAEPGARDGAADGRVITWIRRHAASLVWLTPVIALSTLVHAINLGGAPQRIDDEGTYTAQAWAIEKLGELAHYTYWYDHPPVGWLQLAGYTSVTRAFERYDIAVLAGREAILVFTVVAVVLLWLLARRLGLGRASASIAALIFAVSPLAVQFHRTVYLDNIATPWLLAAFLLALSRRAQLAGFAASAACFGVAVLSKETYLLALPFLAWMMWRGADRSTRRYTLSIAASVLVLIGGGYLLFALVKGELVPGSGRVSLIDGVTFQLSTRESSGTLADPGSLFAQAVSQWWKLDPVLITLGLAASVVGLFLRRVRPVAAMMVFLVAFMFRPGGYLPVPYVIMLLPFASLLIAAVGQGAATQLLRARKQPGAATTSRGRQTVSAGWAIVTIASIVVAVPLWSGQLRGFFLSDQDAPIRNAQTWVADNVPHDSRLLVDDAMWVDLVNAGFDRKNVIWYYKIDTDSEVMASSPNGWKDSDYVVTTESMRSSAGGSDDVSNAIENSSVVARFGEGQQRVDVRRIHPAGASAAQAAADEAAAARAQAGVDLAANPGLTADADVLEALKDGRVDGRALVVVGQLLALGPVEIAQLHQLPGEDKQPYRQLELTAEGSGGSERLAEVLEALSGEYAPENVAVDGQTGTVVVTFSAVGSDGLPR